MWDAFILSDNKFAPIWFAEINVIVKNKGLFMCFSKICKPAALVALSTLGFGTIANATDRYVATNGSDTSNCSVDACATIQYAVNQSVNTDSIAIAAGTYAENVNVNKSIELRGPFAGIHGAADSRDGTGEAIIQPPSGTAVFVTANNVTFDGLTVKGATSVGGLASGNYANGQVLNNRFVDSATGGLYIAGGAASTGWLVQNNLFANLGNAGLDGTAITLVTSASAHVFDNVIRDVSYQGVQLSGTTDIEIRGNQISRALSDGINIAGSSNVLIAENTITDINQTNLPGRGAIRLYANATGIEAYCNIIDAQRGGVALRTGTKGGLLLFHNTVTGSSGDRFIDSNWTGGIDIGSNWYDGTPVVTGPEASSVRVADALPADPIGEAGCGVNAPVAVVAYAGSPQSSVVEQTFAHALAARVVDALGGAVPGVTVEFDSPTSGTTATLSPTSGSSDYNGVVTTAATANTEAGSYSVTADAATPTGTPANFDLTNTSAGFASFTVASGNAQTGAAGLALADPLVVLAVDAFDNPVAGVAIGFAVTSGGGTIVGASTTTNANGLATSGAWTLGASAGTNSAQAMATGMMGVAALDFTATGTEQADIAMQKTSIQTQLEAGDAVDYLLSVTNIGPSNATSVDLVDALPPELNNVTAAWLCIASSGSSCAAASGSGDVSLIGNSIPVGGSVTVLLSATVKSDTPDGIFTNTGMAELTSGVDPDAANNISDRDVEVITIINEIFKDGFEDTP